MIEFLITSVKKENIIIFVKRVKTIIRLGGGCKMEKALGLKTFNLPLLLIHRLLLTVCAVVS